MSMDQEANRILDDIVEHRRTVRSFKSEVPDRALVEAIIHAGLWAPYASLAVSGEKGFRMFFVVQKGSETLKKVAVLIQEQAKASLQQMQKLFEEKPFLKEKSTAYLSRISGMAEKGFPDLLNAPCLIIIAEKRGMPPAERQSLAHVVQNMWLKATALGLGLRLISAIETLTENKGFCELLGLHVAEFAFTGCVVGFSAQEPQVGKRPDDKAITKWM